MKLTLKILAVVVIFVIAFASYNKYQKDREREFLDTAVEDYLKEKENNIKKSQSNCVRTLSFDNNDLCFPKIENWTECRIDKSLKSNVDNLELNNKILAFYIPNEFYEQSKKEEIVNYPVISLFVHNNTIGMETTKEALPMVFAGFKNSFDVQDWKYVQNLLKTKTNAEFLKPILFDSFEISSHVKSFVTINSSKVDDEIVYRVSFVNILDLKKRIMILNYSKAIDKDFQYTNMKIENDKIVNKVTQVN